MSHVLGIHSNVVAGKHAGGHAWITLSSGRSVEYHGLWPDAHAMTRDNGPGFDIRTGLEAGETPAASRYYQLTTAQLAILRAELGADRTWAHTYNCSSWASDVVRRVVGEDVDADSEWLLGAESPVELGQSILALERKRSTSPTDPFGLRPGDGAGASSSSSSSW